MMVTRVAVLAVIVENMDSIEPLTSILHRFGAYILGRMEIPYWNRGIQMLSLAVNAPQDLINNLTDEIGALPGTSVSTAFSRVITNTNN